MATANQDYELYRHYYKSPGLFEFDISAKAH